MIRVSYSRVSCYMSCPKRHDLSYNKRLRTKSIPRPLSFGSDFHKLLENRFSKKKFGLAFQEIEDTYNNLTPAQQQNLGDTYLSDLKVIFEDYRKVWKGEEKPIQLEHKFELPIFRYRGEEVVFVGVIDEVYEDNIMGEHKTFNIAPQMSLLAMNLQAFLYSKANELMTGEKFTKVRWDYIHSKPAAQPIWLDKSQRFSEASNNKITPFSWLRACEERGITDYEVLKLSEKYRHNIPNFYFRNDIELLPQSVDNVWMDFTEATKHLVKHGGSYQTKHISRDCSWCDYRPICFAELTAGEDVVKYIIEKDFEYRPEEEKSDVESDD